MNLQHSIKLLSATVLMSAVWGCSTSNQVGKVSSQKEVYDDLYASASDVRPATLGERVYGEERYNEYAYKNPEYRNSQSSNNEGTDEYYSQNWINSRQVYQNTSQNYYSQNYNPYNSYNYGMNNWYANPSISFGLGFSRWSPFGYSSFGYYDPFYAYSYDPWGWSSSRWMYGYNSWGYSPYGFYDPWSYRYGYGYGFGNTYFVNNNYGSGVTGADNNVVNRPRSRQAYSNSAYNSDFNNSRGSGGTRGNRVGSDITNNNDYYSRPARSGNSYSTGTNSTGTRGNSYSNGRNSSWDWSSGNSNNNRSTNSTSSWSNSSSGGNSSSGSSSGGGGGGGGRSRGPR
ncbi:hypothetical protein [Flectobacillus major]|uniref:hypothetical protein n=1 Tax=Flectobacillus major TaxID=103 RepID=UPI00047DF4C9|nr:hypothetical protein [Flectobacillus major]